MGQFNSPGARDQCNILLCKIWLATLSCCTTSTGRTWRSVKLPLGDLVVTSSSRRNSLSACEDKAAYINSSPDLAEAEVSYTESTSFYYVLDLLFDFRKENEKY
ncbi:uncharacterized protein LOC114308938 [Camellia sinensis]|uniref:uncharacterized protein LOC114308938 n=1 Tax=Camellia sinensis TaxID=4442 RepID=UPI001036F166|nr:uncharacterized protein LOC114308938 [Camellia sinensis]